MNHIEVFIQRFLILLSIILVSRLEVQGQKYLTMELKHKVETIKYQEGELLKFRTFNTQDEWMTKEIRTLIIADNAILMDDRLLHLDDISYIQRTNNGVMIGGQMFKVFGTSWFVIGGIAALADGYTFDTRSVVIGATSLGLGYLMTKIISKQKYTIGKNARLRLIDTRFPTPEEWRLINNN